MRFAPDLTADPDGSESRRRQRDRVRSVEQQGQHKHLDQDRNGGAARADLPGRGPAGACIHSIIRVK
jgi:hypothetical protein